MRRPDDRGVERIVKKALPRFSAAHLSSGWGVPENGMLQELEINRVNEHRFL
jgi:hypothetical protein